MFLFLVNLIEQLDVADEIVESLEIVFVGFVVCALINQGLFKPYKCWVANFHYSISYIDCRCSMVLIIDPYVFGSPVQ